MNELAALLHARLEADPRSKLAQLEWEMLPNETRNLPRMSAWHSKPAPITRAANITRMTGADWRAWGL